MLTRVRGLWSAFSVPGWIILGWVVLGEVHVAKFGVEVLRSIGEYFQEHVFIGLLVGFGFLFLAVLWPGIKDKLPPWFKLPETMHDRVHRINKELPELATGHGGLCRRVDDINSTLSRLQDSMDALKTARGRIDINLVAKCLTCGDEAIVAEG